ncbi:MAG: TRAP transporter TatT component family protein [Myxococcales bacterium]|nr:TRAP transporter TatT component family protein [Myxococcales bacterium]
MSCSVIDSHTASKVASQARAVSLFYPRVRAHQGRACRRGRAFWLGLLLAACAPTLGGCGWLKNMAIDMFASSMEGGSGSLRAHFDWETAGQGAASGIMQLEALYGVRPDNEQLALGLVKSYMAYTYGWAMDDYELALVNEEFDRADRIKVRAYWLYMRAKRISLRVMRDRDPGIDEHLKADPDQLILYLREHYTDAEDDIAPIFWLMMSWSSAVNNSPDGTAFADMPFIRALAQRVIELDETYEAAGALVFMGGLFGSYSKALGGDATKAKDYFERALAITKRRSHLVQLNYARLYAVTAQDKKLYLALLNEIIEAPDQGNEFRLSNKVARRRAYRYLEEADDLFFE